MRNIIIEQTLAVGARLPESAVAARFGVSRTVVRAALAKLVADGLAERLPNQSARVASPSDAEADDLLSVRLEIETNIVDRLVTSVSAKETGKLRAHIRAEEAAIPDRAKAVRLSGEFHILLASATGSKILERYMSDIIARSSLVFTAQTTMYATCCSPREHTEILDLIVAGNAKAARSRMHTHIRDVADRSRQQQGPVQSFADLPARLIEPLV